jgi:hypothetical protein
MRTHASTPSTGTQSPARGAALCSSNRIEALKVAYRTTLIKWTVSAPSRDDPPAP